MLLYYDFGIDTSGTSQRASCTSIGIEWAAVPPILLIPNETVHQKLLNEKGGAGGKCFHHRRTRNLTCMGLT